VEQNEETYESNQASDKSGLFCLKLLYKLDLCRNRLFSECLTQEHFDGVDWRIGNFYSIHSSVMNGTFHQNLPANLDVPETGGKRRTSPTNYSADYSDGDDGPPAQKKARQSKQRTRPNDRKGDQVHNTTQTATLKLKETENYASLIMRPQQLKHLPRQPNSTGSICANYHIIGHCHTLCDRKESHKKLTTDLQRATEAWLKKCRDEFRASTANN